MLEIKIKEKNEDEIYITDSDIAKYQLVFSRFNSDNSLLLFKFASW